MEVERPVNQGFTGANVFDVRDKQFHFRPGPLFTHILLADEINRATPKTQSALLEVMEERSVTVDGVTHQLEEPFQVLATMNPLDHEGTYALPAAQIDRFMVMLEIGYPAHDDEFEDLAIDVREDTGAANEIDPFGEPDARGMRTDERSVSAQASVPLALSQQQPQRRAAAGWAGSFLPVLAIVFVRPGGTNDWRGLAYAPWAIAFAVFVVMVASQRRRERAQRTGDARRHRRSRRR